MKINRKWGLKVAKEGKEREKKKWGRKIVVHLWY